MTFTLRDDGIALLLYIALYAAIESPERFWRVFSISMIVYLFRQHAAWIAETK